MRLRTSPSKGLKLKDLKLLTRLITSPSKGLKLKDLKLLTNESQWLTWVRRVRNDSDDISHSNLSRFWMSDFKLNVCDLDSKSWKTWNYLQLRVSEWVTWSGVDECSWRIESLQWQEWLEWTSMSDLEYGWEPVQLKDWAVRTIVWLQVKSLLNWLGQLKHFLKNSFLMRDH